MSTIAELHEQLAAAGIEYPAKARKADLQDLLDGTTVPGVEQADQVDVAEFGDGLTEQELHEDRQAKQADADIVMLDDKIASLHETRSLLVDYRDAQPWLS